MASDSDDADFFDKLVDDDDDDDDALDRRTRLPPGAADEASALTLADDDAHTGADPPLPPSEVGDALPQVKTVASPPQSGTAAALPKPEGGSPGSAKGVRTAVKQVQWSVFGADTSTIGADPFGDLLADGEDAFLGGNFEGNQGLHGSAVGTSSVGAADHSFSSGVDSNANPQLDRGASAVDFSTDRGGDDDFLWVNLQRRLLSSYAPSMDQVKHESRGHLGCTHSLHLPFMVTSKMRKATVVSMQGVAFQAGF